MINKEAIKLIQEIEEDGRNVTSKHLEALDLAIKALERDGSLSYDEITTSVFSCPVCGAIWRDKEEEE